MKIDIDKILMTAKSCYKVIMGIVGLIVVYLCIWLMKGYGGRPEVKQTIDTIKQTTQINERRADEIIDAAKAREEATRYETAHAVDLVSDDALPDLLAGLLSDWRRENGR